MRIEEVFNVWETEYFWTKLRELTGYEELNSTEMALLYAQHSGLKIVNRLCEKLKDEPDRIATLLYNHYKTNWQHLHEILNLTYDPIANYDKNETETIEGTNTEKRTGNTNISSTKKEDVTQEETGTDTNSVTRKETNTTNNTETGTDTSTRTPNISEKTVNSGNDTTTRKESSFAAKSMDAWSEDYKKNTTSTVTTSGTEKTDDTHNSTLEGSHIVDGTEKGDRTTGRNATNNLTGEETHSEDRTEDVNGNSSTTRTNKTTGNIGVTTSQQMMQSEVDFWNVYNFREQVMKDVDKLLTLSIY